MVLVTPLGRLEPASKRSKSGRLQAKKTAKQSGSSKGARRPTVDSFQTESKSPKALKNKNWRARRDEHCAAANSEKENTYHTPRNDNHNDGAGCSHIDAAKFCTSNDSSSNSTDDYIQIVKELELLALPGDRGHISLVNVVPVCKSGSPGSGLLGNPDNHSKIAKIQQLRTLSPFLEPHIYAERPLSHVVSSLHRSRDATDEREDESTTSEITRLTRDAASQGSYASGPRSIKGVDNADSKHAVDIPGLETAQQHCTGALRNRDDAYQKLIERLNSRKAQDAKRDVEGVDHQWKYRLEFDGDLQTLFRRPRGGNGRRQATNSDFRINYWDQEPPSRDFTETNDSDTGTEVKHNNLNPRAREFLSIGYSQNFTAHQSSTSMRQSRGTERARPPSGTFGQSSSTSPTRRSEQYRTFPSRSTATGTAGNFPQYFGPSFAPDLGHAQRLWQYISNTLALQPAVQAAALGMPPVNGLPHMNANMVGSAFPGVPFIPTHLGTGYLNSFASASLQSPVMDNCRPPVAPKPRFPNATGQQAYEEWIEWRKANEPGYAIECKVRQQRRSQRNKGSKHRFDANGNNPVAPAAAAA